MQVFRLFLTKHLPMPFSGCSCISLSEIPHFEIPLRLAARILFGNILTLVVEFLSSRKRDLHLYQTALKIHLHRNDRIPLFFDLSEQSHDLLFVHQKTFGTHGILVEYITLLVGADMHTVNDDLTVFNMDKCLLDTAVALAQEDRGQHPCRN